MSGRSWLPLLVATGVVAHAGLAAGERALWKPYSPPQTERENVFAFKEKPAVKLLGPDHYEISFAVKGYCDATVAIVDPAPAKELVKGRGRVVRHLASGVLGSNAPEPFQKNILKQTLHWNGKDDLDWYVENPEKLQVRVKLGLKPELDKLLGAVSPYNLVGAVRGMAASPEGKILDPGGIPVSKTPAGSSRFPAVTFDGKDFIVVWSQLEDGNKGNFKLFASRVGQDGQASPPQPLDIQYRKVPIGPKRQDLIEADLAVAGGRVLVTSGVWGSFAQVFSLPELKPVGPKEGLLPKTQAPSRRATSATGGKGFLFSVWCGNRHEDLLQLVAADGKVSGIPPFWCGGKLGLIDPALTFDGENYLLVRQRWMTKFGGGTAEGKGYGVNSHLCARRVTTDGKPVEAADLDVAGTTPDQLNTLPRLASDGKGHVLIVWEQHPATPDGNVVAATRLITTK